MPHDFLKLIAKQDCQVDLPEPEQYGVAMCFLPNSDNELYQRAKSIITETAESLGHAVLGWRKVPTDGSDVGPSAMKTEPVIEQLFLSNSSQSTYGKTGAEQQVKRRFGYKTSYSEHRDRFAHFGQLKKKHPSTAAQTATGTSVLLVVRLELGKL